VAGGGVVFVGLGVGFGVLVGVGFGVVVLVGVGFGVLVLVGLGVGVVVVGVWLLGAWVVVVGWLCGGCVAPSKNCPEQSGAMQPPQNHHTNHYSHLKTKTKTTIKGTSAHSKS
jgi:hypothetical protein